VEEEAVGWGCGVSKGGKGTEAGDGGKGHGVVGRGEEAELVDDVAFGGVEAITGFSNGGADLEFVGWGAGKGDTKSGSAIEGKGVASGGADVREEG
jgi:hypothetical protein